MEHTEDFWNYVERTLGHDPDPGLREWKFDWAAPTARNACESLIAQVEGACQWRAWRTWGRDSQYLLFPLLIALKIGGSQSGRSPCPARYRPEKITLHLAEDEFSSVLASPLPSSHTMTLLWDVVAGRDTIVVPQRMDACLAELLHRRHYDEGDSNYMVESVDGGALVCIAEDKVDIYCLPRNWAMWTAHIIHRRRTKEGTLEVLPMLLSNILDLVGYENVLRVLAECKRD